jgi:hypothetical protein
MTTDDDVVASLAAKLTDWGNEHLSERERQLLLALMWQHADPLDRLRMRHFAILNDAEEAYVEQLESEFGRRAQ